MRINVLVVLVAGLLFPANAAPEDAARRDLKKLQGKWRYVSLVIFGQPVKDGLKGRTVEIKGKALTKGRFGTPFRLDPAKKPRAIDLTEKHTVVSFEGGVQKTAEKEVVAPGIYRLDGDTLTICYDSGGPAGEPERPTKFASEPGSHVTLMVLRRQK
jgi:uncharacterized protein (TIGR03067 family)